MQMLNVWKVKAKQREPELDEVCRKQVSGSATVEFYDPENPHLPFLRCGPVAQSCVTLCDPMDCSTPGFLSFSISSSEEMKWN